MGEFNVVEACQEGGVGDRSSCASRPVVGQLERVGIERQQIGLRASKGTQASVAVDSVKIGQKTI